MKGRDWLYKGIRELLGEREMSSLLIVVGIIHYLYLTKLIELFI